MRICVCLLYVDSLTDWLTDEFPYCPSYKLSNSLILENSYIRALITFCFKHRHLTKSVWIAVCSLYALDCRTRVLLVSFIMLKTKWKKNRYTACSLTWPRYIGKEFKSHRIGWNTNMPTYPSPKPSFCLKWEVSVHGNEEMIVAVNAIYAVA